MYCINPNKRAGRREAVGTSLLFALKSLDHIELLYCFLKRLRDIYS